MHRTNVLECRRWLDREQDIGPMLHQCTVVRWDIGYTGPALANRRPRSNFPPHPLSLPLSFLSLLLPSPTLPTLPPPPFFLLFPSLPPPPRRESALLKPDKRSGERCKLPYSGVRVGALTAVAFCCIVCSQTHLVVAALIDSISVCAVI